MNLPAPRSRRWLRRVLALASALFSLVPAMLAQATAGSITGRIIEAATGAYLEGAEVVISDSYGSRFNIGVAARF